MQDDIKQAQNALLKIAQLKYQPAIEKQGKKLLNKTGIDEENVARLAALARLAAEGELEVGTNLGGIDVGAKLSPEEKAIKFGYKTGF